MSAPCTQEPNLRQYDDLKTGAQDICVTHACRLTLNASRADVCFSDAGMVCVRWTMDCHTDSGGSASDAGSSACRKSSSIVCELGELIRHLGNWALALHQLVA